MNTDADESKWKGQRRAGSWLRGARERRGFTTAREFAAALGWEQQLVSNYETGRSSVSDERADEIARVLRMDILDVRRGLGLWTPEDVTSRNELLLDQAQLDHARNLLHEVVRIIDLFEGSLGISGDDGEAASLNAADELRDRLDEIQRPEPTSTSNDQPSAS